MSWLFASDGQGTAASASVPSMNIQDWFPFSFSSVAQSCLTQWLHGLQTDWFVLLVAWDSQSLLQHHTSKASILRCSAFLMVQHSHLYMTTGKTIALTRRTFVGKVMSLLFNTLSRFITAFLPRSKCLLISRLQSPFAVILEPKKRPPQIINTFSYLLILNKLCCPYWTRSLLGTVLDLSLPFSLIFPHLSS